MIPAVRDEMFEEIHQEREYQDSIWGFVFDDRNTANDWASYIMRYVSKAIAYDVDQQQFEKAMVKVAALAVAAFETSRRNNGPADRHYDDDDKVVTTNNCIKMLEAIQERSEFEEEMLQSLYAIREGRVKTLKEFLNGN